MFNTLECLYFLSIYWLCAGALQALQDFRNMRILDHLAYSRKLFQFLLQLEAKLGNVYTCCMRRNKLKQAETMARNRNMKLWLNLNFVWLSAMELKLIGIGHWYCAYIKKFLAYSYAWIFGARVWLWLSTHYLLWYIFAIETTLKFALPVCQFHQAICQV